MKKHIIILKKFTQMAMRTFQNPIGRKVLIVLTTLIVAIGIQVSIRGTTTQQTQTTTLGLRSIGELATQSAYYTNVNVHEEDKKLFNWSIPLTQSKYIFSYGGVIKAGYDFSQVQVDINELTKQVIVTLPEV